MTTPEFRQWRGSLRPEQQAKVKAALARAARGGPTLGRPLVDVIHGSSICKLKEVRVDRGTRVLFAFDSNQNVAALVGGDKTGKWNRWYPEHIKRAERAYIEHERRNGKEPPCQARRTNPRTPPQRGR